MSIMGTATGTPATIASLVSRIPSESQRATSVDVPPISNVMMFVKSAACAARNAPTTPPAGPDRIVRTGSLAAADAEILPPEDCITLKAKLDLWALDFGLGSRLDAGPDSSQPPLLSLFRYRPINGCKYALMTTVAVRSYSRYSGRI